LIARRLGATRIVMCAAPSYLRVRGTPRSPEDLAHHACIGYLREGHPAPFRFVGESSPYEVPIAGPCHANDADVLRQLAVAGCGIVSLFDFLVTDALASGALVTVLDDHRSTEWPIHALYPRNRHLVPKVAAVLELLIELCRPRTSVPPSSKARRPAGA
jgi:DNA-binding transcriptional LysR family regulator